MNAPTTMTHLLPDVDHRHLDALEEEAIFILREVAASFERPALLFSGGKDSIVMLRLAEKAFWPCKLPFPVLHVDTGHNFSEVIAFRDKRVTPTAARPDGVRLIVASVQESIDTGRVEIEHMHEHGVARDSTFIAPADGTPPTGLIGVRRHLCR